MDLNQRSRDAEKPVDRPGRWHQVIRRTAGQALLVSLDALIVAAAFAVALLLRFDASVPAAYADRFRTVLPAIILTYVGVNLLFRMYRREWRYSSLPDALALGRAVAVSTGLVFVADAALFPMNHAVPLSVVPVGGLLVLLGMGVVRFWHRFFQEMVVAFTRAPQSRVLIVGAGKAGQWLAKELRASPSLGYRPVCFVDDDPGKRGQRVHGLPVEGSRHELRDLVRQYGVDVIALAIPSLSEHERRAILALCEATTARVKIMPGLPELLTEQQQNSSFFRDARLEDLLGRPPVDFAVRDDSRGLSRAVLITGAAGSIGAELARQVALRGVERLILLDIDESGLFELHAELEAELAPSSMPSIELVVADVARSDRVARTFAEHRPSLVFHAAAYKHVPLMEAHPEEAVRTNVFGTLSVCQAAEQSGCERFVFISTDKAVAPANVMGATKRIGERMVEAFAADSRTLFCAVRFGNVLGSRGSVVPTFARQIRQGGPVTITHPEMSRYFMTIPEAVNLIIEASLQAHGGEIFILDMGEPVSIVDLAHKMIRLHGLRPGEDIQIEEVGVRPGEKLRERMVDSDELLVSTSHPRVSLVQSRDGRPQGRGRLVELLDRLKEAADQGSGDELVEELFRVADASRPVPADGRARAEYQLSARGEIASG